MTPHSLLKWTLLIIAFEFVHGYGSFADYKLQVPCDEPYEPQFCGYPEVKLSSMQTLEDFDRCGPSMVSIPARNLYWGASGRKLTYYRNFEAYDRIQILPRMLRDSVNIEMSTTVLGDKISMPIGVAPTAIQAFADQSGEIATAQATARKGTIMILSSLSSNLLEDVAHAAVEAAEEAGQQDPVLWMQLYVTRNRSDSLQIVKRAEKANYRAIVLTIDVPRFASLTCNGGTLYQKATIPNFAAGNSVVTSLDPSLGFDVITWLNQVTYLPIVAKGILTAEDAVKAARAGASAIAVSNHGGRMMDSAPATIEVLPEIVAALRNFPKIEIYVDGGIRNGWSAFKAIASGACAVFLGRPALWGLAIGGEKGVEKVLTIMNTEFNETMTVAGASRVDEINQDFLTYF